MSIKYQMWLTYNAEKEKIQLPVLPESFQIKDGSSNDSLDITGLGEIIIIQSRPALQFSFSSFFPAARFPGVQVESLTKPLTLVEKIREWKASKKPVHLIATACGVDLYASIENFDCSEEGGDPGTYQYSISLKEYREITVRQVKVNIPKAKATVKKTKPRVDNTVEHCQEILRQRGAVHEDLQRKQGSNRGKSELDLSRTGFDHSVKKEASAWLTE